MAGVYLSYPFCAQKCTYCNFASGVFPRELEPQYVDALVAEIASRQWAWPPETVYIGGGTPSRINTGDLERILSSIPGAPWREATLEVAPGTVTAHTAAAWVRAGINRISLGVQSFIQRELARTGRKHTAQVVSQEIGLLRDAGLANINIDLIAGLPGQSAASWRESLEWIERLQPPHVSVYMLEIDEDSRLGQEIMLNGKRYGAPDVPGEQLTAELYETAVDELRRLGIHRYEISNFARPGFESLHNLKYWRLEPYAGFGAGAHSFDGAVRSENVESPPEYVERIRQGKSVRAAATQANSAEERFFVGLRLTQGIRPDTHEWRRFEAPIQRFMDEGLLEREGETLRLTNRGVLFSNEVFAEFITL
ncbi:MAG TPA: radical SAM family heme chaperone HemW [Bryobacteraceae bacterium]|nr:radical SAM family heme chaperone HemW [Bryobacteraceae bacterium]